MTSTPMNDPSTTERRIASEALDALEQNRPSQPDMDGLNDEPTSPRDNPPIDEGRVARAHEDFQRVLGG
jgi:hypothetical protein